MKLKTGMKFSFGDLFENIGLWFLLGVFIGGIITVFLSQEIIESYLGGGLFSMIVMIVFATPLYVCATASTPIAAALALKGLSPGAALVFLLAGPATNAASLTVISKILGKKTAFIYIISIIFASLVCGLMVNYLYSISGIDIKEWIQVNQHETYGFVSIASTVIVIFLLLKSLISKFHLHRK